MRRIVVAVLMALVAPVAAAQDEALGAQAQLQPQAAAQELIAEVRFHGNHTIPDEELLAMVAISAGDPLTDATFEQIEQRLRDSGRVDSVEIVKRYRSLTRTDQVVLIITVHERISVTQKFMFLPILSYSDELGFTYGARFTTIDLLGANERISFPLSWGGIKQAAAEARFDIDRKAISGITAGTGIRRIKNPHYDIDDTRVEVSGGVFKRAGPVQVDFEVDWQRVEFAEARDDLLNLGIAAKLDTRQEAYLPRNAVYLGAAYDRLHILDSDRQYNRFSADVRGYVGLIGHTILASQFVYKGADGHLPEYERLWLGGAQTLRGYSTAEFIGDNLATGSIEFRWPLAPPVQVGQFGLDLFVDTGTVYDHGESLRDATFYTGVGGGVFFFALGFGLKVDVGYGLEEEVGGGWHFHFSTSFRY
jgi:outer membrane protein assembly factor BamA